jgi:TolB protein
MNADGSDQRQVTALGGANFGPSWSPDGTKIIFSSNFVAPRSGNFELYLVDASGVDGRPRQARGHHHAPRVFDGFAMFSPDGTKLLWAIEPQRQGRGETNVFVADFRWD